MSISIGIDVSKETLEICDESKSYTITNTEKAIKEAFKNMSKETHIIMEATGKYHRLAHQTLNELGFLVMIINPYQSRYFAKALNIHCKTDSVDSAVLRRYGESMEFQATAFSSEKEAKMQELSRHLADLLKVRLQLEARQRDAIPEVYESLKKCIDSLVEEIKAVEKTLELLINRDKELKHKYELLCSIPGVGQKTATVLLCLMKELGLLSKNKISALVGVAPMNNDSGQFKGKRTIRGGRYDVRSYLYMPTLGAATMHNKRLKAYYDRLVAKGKPKKVAITACIRKMVIWANAILATSKKWDENYI